MKIKKKWGGGGRDSLNIQLQFYDSTWIELEYFMQAWASNETVPCIKNVEHPLS